MEGIDDDIQLTFIMQDDPVVPKGHQQNSEPGDIQISAAQTCHGDLFDNYIHTTDRSQYLIPFDDIFADMPRGMI